MTKYKKEQLREAKSPRSTDGQRFNDRQKKTASTKFGAISE